MSELVADVLVLGGGPAGTWAAVAAAATGATVVLADKGYCGTSGAAAAGGNNLWTHRSRTPQGAPGYGCLSMGVPAAGCRERAVGRRPISAARSSAVLKAAKAVV